MIKITQLISRFNLQKYILQTKNKPNHQQHYKEIISNNHHNHRNDNIYMNETISTTTTIQGLKDNEGGEEAVSLLNLSSESSSRINRIEKQHQHSHKKLNKKEKNSCRQSHKHDFLDEDDSDHHSNHQANRMSLISQDKILFEKYLKKITKALHIPLGLFVKDEHSFENS